VKVVWSPLANDQIDEAVAFIVADDPAAALEWLEGLLERVKSLAAYPDSGRIVPELERDDVRELIVSPCRVIYRRGAEVVEIASIRHGAREFDAGVT
jgi:toxin ParE1/3/4